MKSRIVRIGVALAVVLAGLGLNGVFAQQAPVKRNFEAEIQSALQSAKTRVGPEKGRPSTVRRHRSHLTKLQRSSVTC